MSSSGGTGHVASKGIDLVRPRLFKGNIRSAKCTIRLNDREHENLEYFYTAYGDHLIPATAFTRIATGKDVNPENQFWRICKKYPILKHTTKIEDELEVKLFW